MSSPKFTAPETPVTREEVYYDAILRGLNGDSPAPVIPTPVWRMEEYLAAIAEAASSGGSSLPSVTSADNGKVLAVKDGAWAADSNLFLVTVALNEYYVNVSDKTYAEISSAIDAGKTVLCYRNDRYYTLTAVDVNAIYFYSASDATIIAINASGTGKSASITFKKFLPSVTGSDNGSELIVKNGSWAKQAKKFIVTLTPTSPDYSGTMDKTVAEMTEAYNTGMQIVWRVIMASDQYVDVNVTAVMTDTDYTYPSFNAFVIEINTGVLVYAHIPVTNDGTKQTYSTTVYPLTPAS